MSKKNTGIAKVSAEVPSMLKLLDDSIAKLQKIEETPFKTGSTKVDGFNNSISTETNMENLIRMHHSITAREEGYTKSGMALFGKKPFPAFNIGGFSKADFIHDIELRIQIIKYQDTYNKLKGFKEKATELMSKEEQKEILFSEIENFIKRA